VHYRSGVYVYIYVSCIIHVCKQLLVELHIKQIVVIFSYLFVITPLSNVLLVAFLKLNSSRHPAVTTLKPVAADQLMVSGRLAWIQFCINH